MLRVIVPPILNSADGKIIFHTAMLPEGIVLTPGDPIVIHLDPSQEPLFSEHPEGGWVSPPFHKLKEMAEIGITPDDMERIICPCHKNNQYEPQDVESLQRCGHRASCRKARPPGLTVQAAPNAAPFLLGNTAAPQAVAVPTPAKNPALAAEIMEGMKAVQAPSQPPPVPPGGLSAEKLGELWPVLDGCETTDVSLVSTLAEIGEPTANIEVVMRQLMSKEFWYFGICQRCECWHQAVNPTTGICKGCTKR